MTARPYSSLFPLLQPSVEFHQVLCHQSSGRGSGLKHNNGALGVRTIAETLCPHVTRPYSILVHNRIDFPQIQKPFCLSMSCSTLSSNDELKQFIDWSGWFIFAAACVSLCVTAAFRRMQLEMKASFFSRRLWKPTCRCVRYGMTLNCSKI